MPKERTYRISLNPTQPDAHGGWTTRYSLRGDPSPTADVVCSSFDELDRATRELFESTDWAHAQPYVRIIDGGRKPNGFDAWCEGHRRYSLPDVSV